MVSSDISVSSRKFIFLSLIERMKTMVATIVIGIIIAAYAGVVIRKKVKDMKNGKFCSCGCSDCASSCHKKID